MTTPRPSQMIYRRSKLATYQRRSSKKFYIRLILFKFCAFYGTRLGRFHVGIIFAGSPIGGLTPTLQKLEGFRVKASEDEVVVLYFEPSATQNLKPSGFPKG